MKSPHNPHQVVLSLKDTAIRVEFLRNGRIVRLHEVPTLEPDVIDAINQFVHVDMRLKGKHG